MYLCNIKYDLSFYITLTLKSLVLNEIISSNVCTLMMCLSWKQSIQFLHQFDRTIDLIHHWFLNTFSDGMLLRALIFFKWSFVSNLYSLWMISKVLPLVAFVFLYFQFEKFERQIDNWMQRDEANVFCKR